MTTAHWAVSILAGLVLCAGAWADGKMAPVPSFEKATLAILVDDFPDEGHPGQAGHGDPALQRHRGQGKAEAIEEGLRERGFGVTVLSGEEISREGVLNPTDFDAVVLPDANVFPVEGLEPLLRYLRMGGKMAAVGTQPFATRVHNVGGRWVDREGLKGRLADVRPTHMLEDFEGGGRLAWQRSTDSREHEGALTIQPGGAGETGHGAKVAVEDLTGWDTFGSGEMETPFPEGQTLTCFWAKGDRKTPRMSIEWRERDGSRWIGVVELERRWRHYAMEPEDFVFWPNGSTAGRGGAGDLFDPANAEQIVFGVAYSHTGHDPGPKTFWIDEVGTARNPLPELEWPPAPVLEIVSPAYKLYPLTQWHDLVVEPYFIGEPRHTGSKLPVPPVRLRGLRRASSPVRRPVGQGFGTGAKYRWVPLVEARGGDGTMRGAPVSMLLNFGGMYRLSAWTLFAFDDAKPWHSGEATSLLTAALERMTGGVALCEAGSEYFSYFPDEDVTLGAKLVNLGDGEASARVRLAVRSKADGGIAFEKSFDVSIPPQDTSEVSVSWQPGELRSEGYTVTCELVADGEVADSISHEIGVLEERGRLDRASLVTVRDGDFSLRGEPWQPHGINYWGLYVAGSEPSGYGLGWLTPGFYQPDEVERDLQQIAALGMDVLSVQYNTRAVSRNLLDFLRRARAHGFLVNVFIGAAEPMRFDRAAAEQLIEAADLTSNEAVFAYDVSWEPRFGGRGGAGRLRYDGEWAKWIAERYGSIENAERDWGVACPRRDGAIASPSDRQLFEDGEHRVMAVAYRRFMQDFIGQRFRDAVRQLREIDPNRLISFRTGASVTGGNGRGDYSYDFATAARHVDFLCPEGWALRDDARPGGFATAYCQMVAPGKPVMWAEYGYNIWDKAAMAPDPERRMIQRDRYEEFYRMFLESGAKGAISWYWAGWFRVGEDSDFGICPQDRRPRPVWSVIRKYGARLRRPRPRPEPDTWITIDTQAHPAGYHHVFREKSAKYLAALDAGKRPALRTEGTGTTSADTPLVAVGNTPYNGSNPPKYLNAELDEVAIRNADGEWVRLRDGARVEVKAGAPIMARASMGNTGEAAWLAVAGNGEAGGVYLSSRLEGGLEFAQPIPEDVPSLGEAEIPEFALSGGITVETKVNFEAMARDRAWFGEKMTVTLAPAQETTR